MRHQTSQASVLVAQPPSSDCHIPEQMEFEVEKDGGGIKNFDQKVLWS